MKTRTTWLTAILALALGGFPLLSSAAAPLADKVPAGALAYVGLAGKTPAFDKTNLAKLIQEPAVQEVFKAIDKAIAANVPPDERAKLDKAFTLLHLLLHKPVAIAMMDLAGKDPVSLCLLADLGDDKAAFDNQLTALLADLKMQVQPAETAGKNYSIVAVGPVAVSMGYLGNVFFLHVGSQLEKLLAVTAETSLRADKAFAEKFAKVDGENVQLALFVDVAKVTEAIKRLAPMDEQAGKIAQALGVSKITHFASAMRIDGPDFHTRAMLFSPAPHQGVLKLFAGSPITPADLAGLGATTELLGVAKISPAELYREVRSVVKQIDPTYEDALDGWQATFKMTTGVSLVGDILPSLGDAWVLSSDSAQGGLLTGTMLTVTLKDPAKIAEAIDKFQTLLTKQFPGEAGEGRPETDRPWQRAPAVRAMKAGTAEIRYVTNISRDVFPIAPAWAIHEGKLYVALWPQVIAAAVDPAARPSGRKPLADAPAFAQLRSKLADKPVMMAYVNWPALVREFYPLALMGWTALSNMRDIPLPLRPDWLPPPAVLETYLAAQLDAVSAGEDGILFESHSSLPSGGPMMSVTSVSMGVAIALPALTQAREQARRAVCASNLHQLGIGLQMYRTENRDTFPKDLQQIMKYLGDAKHILKCPSAPPGRAVDYFYQPPGKDDAEAVIMAEFKGNHRDGRNVGYADGHVRWMSEADFQAELAKPANAPFAAALKKAEGGAQPAPGETPRKEE